MITIIKKIKFDTFKDACLFMNTCDYLIQNNKNIKVYMDGYEGVSTYTVTIEDNREEKIE